MTLALPTLNVKMFPPAVLRACLKIPRGAVFVPRAGWRGVTKENTLHGSSTGEQQSQAALGAKTLPPSLKLRRDQPGGGAFVLVRRWLGRPSPLWGCTGLAALAKAKIPRRSIPCNFQTGSWRFKQG